ncbi:MAG: efflux transporter periplasmic adaptor subunit [Acidobacteria bacterium]|nr:MAG: efflux transporter periplasmic adaptor subunit [Acidobacteriota bacterium]PYV26125.1 MAG: efflux transporter periplasmic adaptor subunit [Acidobacteriota bacterium]
MKTNIILKRELAVWVTIPLIAVALLGAAACSKPTSAARPGDPPDVEVARVEQKDVPIYGEWIGTLDGMVNADVKAQVTGYLLAQAYKEGSFVKDGQVLFEIDPRPFQAALGQAEGQLAQAKAQLANAEAVQGRTQLDVDRYTPLVKEQAASQQDLDNAIQNNLAAKATVATAKAQIQAAEAAVQTARLNLEFTRLTSPIDGIAGVAQLQVGALVSPSSPPVTTVSTVDPIKVYFTVSEQEYLDWNRRFPTEASLDAANRRVRLELILADGTTYPREGTVYFADRQVNQSTGAIRIAGLFPNAGNFLRPGGYGRVRAATRIKRGALLVPQRAVTELQGSYQVAVVDRENKVGIRTVKVGDRVGSLWIIEEGLNPGERVVAEGVQKVRPGAQVNPKPFDGGAKGKGA